MIVKRCIECRIELNNNNWYNSDKKSKYYHCKECRKKKNKQWVKDNFEKSKYINNKSYENNKQKVNSRSLEWRKKNKEVETAARHKNRELNKEKVKINNIRLHLQREYNISFEEYVDMLQKQEGLCSLCKTPFSKLEQPHIDHDHNTNKIRGVIHRNCNLLLGFSKDTEDLLLLAIEYLKKHGGKYDNSI